MMLLGAPLAVVVILLWLETTDVDRFVMGWFFDPVLQGFPLRHNEFLEVVLHQWAKDVVVLLGALAIAGYLLSFLIEALKPQRRVLLFLHHWP